MLGCSESSLHDRACRATTRSVMRVYKPARGVAVEVFIVSLFSLAITSRRRLSRILTSVPTEFPRVEAGGRFLRQLSLDRALELRLAPLLALLDVDVEDRHWQALDPPQRRQRNLTP
jgi:hypothetical protein